MGNDAGPIVVCCCGGTCCGGIIFGIIALISSFATVEQGQYAMKFSHWSQNVDGPPIKEPGVKFVGFPNSLVRWPSVQQMMYFDTFSLTSKEGEILNPPIHSRTRDGLTIYVKVSFQWQLQASRLEGIYGVLGGAEDILDGERVPGKPGFGEAISRFARGALTLVVSNYTASKFFTSQQEVQNEMKRAMNDAFNKPEKGLVITIAAVQLRSVDLPDAYENSIAETQKEEQAFQTAKAEKDTKVMQQTKLKMEAEKRQEKLRLDAEANAKKTAQETEAWITQYELFQSEQAAAYAEIIRNIQDSDPYASLFELMSQKAVKEHASTKLTMAM